MASKSIHVDASRNPADIAIYRLLTRHFDMSDVRDIYESTHTGTDKEKVLTG
jgi:hypothetical protein